MNERLTLRKQRTKGELLGDAFSFYGSQWSYLAALVAPAVLVQVASGLLQLLAEDDLGLSVALSVLFIPLSLIAQQLVSAGVVVVLLEQEQNRTIEVGDALDKVQDRAGALVRAVLQSTIIVTLMTLTIVLIPLAVRRFVQWSLIVQSIMVDSQPGSASLSHSARLVQGRWWSTFGRLLLAGLVIGAPAFIVTVMLQSIFPGIMGAILGAAPSLVTIPYLAIAYTLIFFDLKSRKAEDEPASIA